MQEFEEAIEGHDLFKVGPDGPESFSRYLVFYLRSFVN